MRLRFSPALSFWSVAYTLAVVMIGTNVPAPLYSVYGHMWGFSSGMVTLLFAVYAFVLVPSSLVFGQLSDKLGRKRLLISGVMLAAIASIVFALAHGTWMLLLARAIQGLCVGMLNGTAIATLAELRPTNLKGASLVASVAIAVGTATGPLYAGILAQYAPFPIRLPYYIHLALLVPACLGIMATSETVRRETKGVSLHVPSIPRFIRSRFLTATFIAVLAWAVAGFFMVVAPTFVTTLVGIDNLAISGAVVFLMLGASTLAQISFQSIPLGRAMFIGFVLLSTGIVCVLISISTHILWLFLASTVIAGAGHGPTASGSLRLVTEISPSDSRADAVSSYYAIAYLGVSVPVLGLGLIAEWIGMYGGIWVFAAAIVLSLFVLSFFVSSISLRNVKRCPRQPDSGVPNLDGGKP
ncbi:MFS transporter [Alicyclobacillus fastidiosus]|uniref:MFS transporter n=1 Tax=Alicyclobacillus fastidiosus TaxID=392011 RepID=A0ABV5A9N6_9BACL|nr:MFS transporter [Alicyclobacillus fastidiosus]WEH10901.1 MFS transporter [Alicyclobacillus fastidiosus]